MIELDPYWSYRLNVGKLALYEETSTEIRYDEDGNELPF